MLAQTGRTHVRTFISCMWKYYTYCNDLESVGNIRLTRGMLYMSQNKADEQQEAERARDRQKLAKSREEVARLLVTGKARSRVVERWMDCCVALCGGERSPERPAVLQSCYGSAVVLILTTCLLRRSSAAQAFRLPFEMISGFPTLLEAANYEMHTVLLQSKKCPLTLLLAMETASKLFHRSNTSCCFFVAGSMMELIQALTRPLSITRIPYRLMPCSKPPYLYWNLGHLLDPTGTHRRTSASATHSLDRQFQVGLVLLALALPATSRHLAVLLQPLE
jgi:hypothetical protein